MPPYKMILLRCGVQVLVMLAALPFVRYVQLMAGDAQALHRDSQIRAPTVRRIN